MKLFGRKWKVGFIVLVFLVSVVCEAYAVPTVYPTSTTILNPVKAYRTNVMYRAVIDGTSYILLIDMRGNILHRWSPEGYDNLNYAEPLDNGNILAIARKMDQTTAVIELDWDSNVVMEYSYIGAMVHHDLERLDNGNTLILFREVHVDPEISVKPLYDDFIVEINPQGEIVWEWHTYDHFNEFGFSDTAKQLIYDAGEDWAHANSIQSLPPNTLDDPRFREGNILVSQRETNTIFIIDKETGDVVWNVGPEENLTIAQHDARMIEMDKEGAGNILVFDNGGDAGYPSQFRFHSRVLEIEPLSSKIVYKYKASNSNLHPNMFFSYCMSGARKLPNGNILITEAETGRFFQITPDGEIVWEYVNPYYEQGPDFMTNIVYRALPVSKSWPGQSN